jgi:hypothetical protein
LSLQEPLSAANDAPLEEAVVKVAPEPAAPVKPRFTPAEMAFVLSVSV